MSEFGHRPSNSYKKNNKMSTPQTKVEDKMLMRADLCKALSVSPETLRRWIKAGTIPTPDINLSLKTQAWRKSSLLAAGIGIL